MTAFSNVTTTKLPPAFVGEPYEASFAVNGSAAAVLTVEAGGVQTNKVPLPDSLSYTTDGRITGTPVPADEGTYNLSVKVTDGTNTKDNIALTLTIFGRGTIAYYEDTSTDAQVSRLGFGDA